MQKLQPMMNRFRSAKTTLESDPKAKELIAKLKKDFELNMNNHLHVEDAFKAIFSTVSKLASLEKKGKLNRVDAGKALTTMKNMNQVLQVIF